MLGHCDVYRYFVFVLICAAVMSFIMCSHAARASPIITSHHGEKIHVLRRVHPPHSQHHPLSAGLLSKDRIETSFRDTLPVINHQSLPVQYIKGSFSLNQDNGDNRRPRVTITKVQRGGMRPASSIFTSHPLYGGQNSERWPSRTNGQKEHPGTSYAYRPVIIRKSDSEGDSAKADKEKFLGKLIYPPFPSQPNQHFMSRGHYTAQKEANELPLAKTQPSKVLSFTRRTDPRAATLANNWDATVGKRNPSQEQLPPYLPNYSNKFNSVSSRETLRHTKLQPHLFKDYVSPPKVSTGGGRAASHGPSNAETLVHKQSLSGSQVQSQSVSYFRPFSRIKQEPDAQSVSLTQSFTSPLTVRPTFHNSAQSPPQTPLHPFSVKVNHLERSVLSANAHLWDNYATRRDKMAVESQVNATRHLTHYHKPGGPTKGILQLRQLKPLLQSAKPSVSSPTEATNSQQPSPDKGLAYRLRIANAYPYISQKYNFGQRGASANPVFPAKPESVDTFSPSPSALHVAQLTVSTPRPFTTASKHTEHPQNAAGISGNTTQGRFKLYKKIFDLEGFSKQPLEGAKDLAESPNVTALPKPGLKGFKLQRLQSWQPERIRIHRWYNQTGGGMQGSGSISSVGQKELSGRVFKPLPETERSSKPSSDHSKVHPSQGTNAQNRTLWRSTMPNIAASVSMRSAVHRKVASSFNSRQRAAKRTNPVPERGLPLNTSTSSIVRGKRVRHKPKSNQINGSSSLTNATRNVIIVRQLKHSITYADIVGSASFSSVKAANQTPSPLIDRGYSANRTTAEPKGRPVFKADDGRNMSRSPEADVNGEEKDLEEADIDVQTAELFLDHEGSGVGSFNLSDVLSTDTGSQTAGKDALELDYLRISTGNIYFESAKQPDQQ